MFRKLIKKLIINLKNKTLRCNSNRIDIGTKIGKYCNIGEDVIIGKNVSIGDFSYINHDSIIDANCKIGKFCSIGPEVSISPGNHPLNLISTHPFLYDKFWMRRINVNNKSKFIMKKKITEIGNDVWIGTRAIILEGVTVGDGCIIAANAVVTKDVPPYAMVAGIPARIIKYRFLEYEITKLLKIKWWNWDIKILRENYDIFFDMSKFNKLCEEKNFED